MKPEPSVHDNLVYAYRVDCERRRIVLHTAFRHREPHEFTDVVFHDVVAHHFEHVRAGNILFDVEEFDVDALVPDNAEMFNESWRYGWPPIEYGGDLAVLTAGLRAASVRFVIVRPLRLGVGGQVRTSSARCVCAERVIDNRLFISEEPD